ncbi:hypothetical protein EV193_10723 [Herbihabitans rhizosphaerae]|uniref:Aminoglycoside phosphotransferase domain-containing protein n=1 Tax=Herbihabitans rhizosphaerae TaxID=1872711 RepID=A0A4Q7KMC1_9PSEU|nr:phosphotransferase [Herbihabitans rhizosphaerae]RZS36342.1 hypothetical protein EV193_10723 [Herbihabitans rhizosphaerae]
MSRSDPAAVVPPPVIDVREEQHDDVLDRVESALGVRLDRSSVVYGEHGATEGFRTIAGTWLRVERRGRWRINSAAWVGLEASASIRGVQSPDWFQGVTWIDSKRNVVWRADEVELIPSPPVGDLATASALPDTWWAGLRESLAALAAHQTERVGVRQTHLTKRITEVFSGVDTTVYDWTTSHTDLHWSNLTVDGHLLDWEEWGTAPRGYDAACLWQASLPSPMLTERVQNEFATDLQTHSGKLSQLMLCANAIRIASKRGTPTALSEPAKAASAELLADLRS